MTALSEELPFSDFLHHPAAAADRLATVRTLRLRRRGASDLALMRADQAERDGVVVDFTARLLAGLVRQAPRDVVRGVLPEALPWVRFLPERDVDQLLAELVDVTLAAAALDNLNPVATLLEHWRHSAEVHAEPALLEMLTREPEGDFGAAVPPPVPPDEP
jgi:hypothetical protein